MIVTSSFFNKEIELSDTSPAVLIIENKFLFRDIVLSFEKDMSDDLLVFSENYKPFEFVKKGLFISDPLSPSFDSKKLLGKINSALEEMAKDDAAPLFREVRESLLALAEKLSLLSELSITYDGEISAATVIKLLGFRVDRYDMTLPEQLDAYLRLCASYLGIHLFVIPNLHLYFTAEEIDAVYESAALHHIALLILEGADDASLIGVENRIIVDADLCLIDSGEKP